MWIRNSRWERSDGRVAVGLAAAMALLLGACGGGGDSGSGSGNAANTVGDVAAQFAAADSLNAVYAAGLHFDNLQATDSAGGSVSMAFDLAPLGMVNFDGRQHPGVLRTVTITHAGQTPVVARSVQVVNTAPLQFLGSVIDSGVVAVALRTGDLPAVARAGDSGPLYVSTAYSDASKTTVLGTVTVTWSVEGVDADRSYLCLNATQPNADAQLVQTTNECLLLDNTRPGQVVGARITYTQGSVSLTFR